MTRSSRFPECFKSGKLGHTLQSVTLIALMSFAGNAMASVTTYSGQDDGAPTTGPFPNSSAAQTTFKTAAAAYGSLNTLTFEGLPTGFGPFTTMGVNVGITGANYGPSYSGLTTTTSGNVYGFNTTPGGDEFLGTSGDTTTFTFSSPTHSFGLWLTGLQTIFTASLPITFNDGTLETELPPIDVNGGAQFFGFTDTSAFSSVTIADVKSSNGVDDGWGLDDVTYNGTSVVTGPTPEPSSLLLLGTGALAIAGTLRRRLGF